jgi:phage shock protein A
LDRAEDPAETLDYSYEKQLELVQNVKRGIADVVTSKKRLQLQEQSLRQQAEKLDGQARLALGVGNEELARTALQRKQAIEAEVGSLDDQVVELEGQQEQLIANEQKLQTKMEAFRSKKEVIKAQYSAAEAQVRISEAATGVGEQMADVGLAMQRAIDKTENMKARADAVSELEAAGTFEDLTQLGPGEDDVDRQAGAGHERERGRLGAREDESRARRRRAGRAAPRGRRADRGGSMIVRIATEGQYRMADDQVPRLEELVAAVEAGDRDRFTQAFAELLGYVRGGELLDDAHLGPSDAILPPPDVSFEEASGELSGEGLLPD